MVYQFQFKVALLLIGFSSILLNMAKAQSLFTETGSNISPSQVNCRDIVPGSIINVNNSLVEVGSYSGIPIQTDIRLHVQCDSQIERINFSKYSRWYQEVGATQVFRIYKGEDEPSGDSRARTEVFTTYMWGPDDGWQEWGGRITLIKPIACSMFQIKSNGKEGYEWPLQIDYGNGRLIAQIRIPKYSGGKLSGGRTIRETPIGNFGPGDSFDLKVRDNGKTLEVYINGVKKEEYTAARPPGSEQRFRWGLYNGKHLVPTDAMILVSNGGIKNSKPAGLINFKKKVNNPSIFLNTAGNNIFIQGLPQHPANSVFDISGRVRIGSVLIADEMK